MKIAKFANHFFSDFKTPQNIGPMYSARNIDIGAPDKTVKSDQTIWDQLNPLRPFIEMQEKHLLSAFGPLYKHDFTNNQAAQTAQTVYSAEKTDKSSAISSESSSASSPSGGEKS